MCQIDIDAVLMDVFSVCHSLLHLCPHLCHGVATAFKYGNSRIIKVSPIHSCCCLFNIMQYMGHPYPPTGGLFPYTKKNGEGFFLEIVDSKGYYTTHSCKVAVLTFFDVLLLCLGFYIMCFGHWWIICFLFSVSFICW